VDDLQLRLHSDRRDGPTPV